MSNAEQTQEERDLALIETLIAEGDVDGLVRASEGDYAAAADRSQRGRWRLCACLGPRGKDKYCPCRMLSKRTRDAVSLAALRRGRIVRLSGRQAEAGG